MAKPRSKTGNGIKFPYIFQKHGRNGRVKKWKGKFGTYFRHAGKDHRSSFATFEKALAHLSDEFSKLDTDRYVYWGETITVDHPIVFPDCPGGPYVAHIGLQFYAKLSWGQRFLGNYWGKRKERWTTTTYVWPGGLQNSQPISSKSDAGETEI